MRGTKILALQKNRYWQTSDGLMIDAGSIVAALEFASKKRALVIGKPKKNYFLEAAGKTAAETIGNVIAGSDKVIASQTPDALLILGDTNSCLSAISAKRRKIPIFHMEAGNRCFDQRVPEEINRKIVDHISDINLTYTEHARRYLLLEGLKPETIIKSGSPMKEVLLTHIDKIKSSNILDQLGLKKDGYFIFCEPNKSNPFTFLFQILQNDEIEPSNRDHSNKC